MSDSCETCDPVTTDSVQEKQLEAQPELVKPVVEDVLDPTTFTPPSIPSPGIVIEFCDRCRWLHRATWVQTELFLTFPTPALKSISIIPHNSLETGGRFRVWLSIADEPGVAPKLIWDRKTQGGFPELKDLKQRIRDIIQPGLSLGHSDKHTVPKA